MLTRKALKEKIDSFILDLLESGIQVRRVVLFGSYSKGNPNDFSDIDLAIWADQFEGYALSDIEKYLPYLRNHHRISVRPYKTGMTIEDDPFLEEILHTGQEWNLPVLAPSGT
jgi:predicted nucleotidyltransferase